MLRKFFMCAMVLLIAFGMPVKSSGRKSAAKPKEKVKIKYDYQYDDIVNYLYSGDRRGVLIAHCESFDFKADRYGIHVVGDNGLAYGLFQFHYGTFMEFAKKAGVADPNWKDPYQQIHVANWMIIHGYIKNWACYWILRRYHRL